MNKYILMALLAIILVTAVSYDSYAINIDLKYNGSYIVNENVNTIHELENIIIDFYDIQYVYKDMIIFNTMDNIRTIYFHYYDNQQPLFYYKDQYGGRFTVSKNGTLQTIACILYDEYILVINEENGFNNSSLIYYEQLNEIYTTFPIYTDNTFTNIKYPISDNITSSYQYVIDYLSPPPEPIPLPDEYLYITTPPEGHKNIDKFMTYNVMYKIAADQIADVKLNVRNEEGLPFGEDPDVISYNAVNHNATIENGYVSGTLQIMVDYQTTFVGPIGIQLDVLNEVTNRQLSITRNVEIVAFVDADGDGIDDNTGQPLYDAEEAIVISSPAYGSRTVNRLVPLNFFIRIKASNVDSVLANTQILYQNPTTSIWENLLISDIMNNFNSNINNRNQLRLWNFYKNGEYITLNMTVNLLFADNFLGEVPFRIITTSDTTGKQLITNHKFHIGTFVDSNNDGIDDNTGEMYNPNPELPSYDDEAGSINDAIGTLKNVLPAITTSLATIVSLLTFIFGWLPVEIRVLMVTVMTLIGITTIVKVLRG